MICVQSPSSEIETNLKHDWIEKNHRSDRELKLKKFALLVFQESMKQLSFFGFGLRLFYSGLFLLR